MGTSSTQNYSMRKPEIARAMTSCWIGSELPRKSQVSNTCPTQPPDPRRRDFVRRIPLNRLDAEIERVDHARPHDRLNPFR
jgi:hypothetical protein